MSRVRIKTTRRAAAAAKKLRAGLDGTGQTSPEVMAALQERPVRVWLETWIMPALDDLAAEIDEGRS